jgi:hypothetical protein
MGKLQELWEKQKSDIARNAAPHLDPGETVRYVVLGQTRLPNWLAPIPFAALYGVKKCAVVVTDRSVYVVAMPMLSPTKVVGVVEKRELTSASLKREGGAVLVGNTKIWPVNNAFMNAELTGALGLSGKTAS